MIKLEWTDDKNDKFTASTRITMELKDDRTANEMLMEYCLFLRAMGYDCDVIDRVLNELE